MKELFKKLSSVSNFFNEKRFIFGAETQNPLEPPKFVEQGASDKELSDLMDKALGKDAAEKLADESVQGAKKAGDDLFAQGKIEDKKATKEEGKYDVDAVLAEARANESATTRSLRNKATASLRLIGAEGSPTELAVNKGRREQIKGQIAENINRMSGGKTREELVASLGGGNKDKEEDALASLGTEGKRDDDTQIAQLDRRTK